MDDALKTKLEAAAFRALQKHLMVERTDVQNIDLMNLSGFCRNCLSNWYKEAANDFKIEINKSEAREIIYGMPHDLWKEKYQKEASKDQLNKFDEKKE